MDNERQASFGGLYRLGLALGSRHSKSFPRRTAKAGYASASNKEISIVKKHVFSIAAASIFLMAAAFSATAAPLDLGKASGANSIRGILQNVRSGGGHGIGGMHIGGMGIGGFHAAHFSGRPRIIGRSIAGLHLDHHHRGHRFLFAGYPYVSFDDGYYDAADYGSACWWSGRYHHWVCPDY